MKTFYQRGMNLSNKTICLSVALLCSLSGQMTVGVRKAFPAPKAQMTVLWPSPASENDRMRIKVKLPQSPVNDAFYHIEVDIDGKPIAISDVSRTRKASIDLPPLPPGTHTTKVIWLNPPGGKKEAITGSIQVLSGK